MSKFKLADDLRGLLSKVQPLFDLADGLEKVGSLELAADQAVERKKAAYEELAKAEAALKSKLEDVKSAESKVAEEYAKAKDLKDKQDNMLLNIEAQRRQKIADEEAKFKSIQDKLGVELKGKQDELADVKAQIAKANAELDAVQAQVVSVKEKLNEFIRG